jgi:hypothetical protein
MKEKQKISRGAKVLCPNCRGCEMEYERKAVVLTSLPPKANVVCPNCAYKGFKIL